MWELPLGLIGPIPSSSGSIKQRAPHVHWSDTCAQSRQAVNLWVRGSIFKTRRFINGVTLKIFFVERNFVWNVRWDVFVISWDLGKFVLKNRVSQGTVPPLWCMGGGDGCLCVFCIAVCRCLCVLMDLPIAFPYRTKLRAAEHLLRTFPRFREIRNVLSSWLA